MLSYDAAWQEYRRRRNIGWLILLTYVPGVIVIAMLTYPLVRSYVPGFVAAGLWMIAAVIWGNYTIRWKCPRCQQPFFTTWWYHNSFARKCAHCGLRKWSNDLTQAVGRLTILMMAPTSWEDYRRYSRRFQLVWLGSLAAGAVVVLLASNLGRLAVPLAAIAGPIVLSGWLVAFLATGLGFQGVLDLVGLPHLKEQLKAGRSLWTAGMRGEIAEVGHFTQGAATHSSTSLG